jgi:predicted outer membrane repeat protein
VTTTPSTRAPRPRRALTAVTALVLGFAGALAVPTAASAADFSVTNTNDSGAGSLRDALALAGPADTVVFDATVFGEAFGMKTISLLTPLVIDETTTIVGPGSAWLTVNRGVATPFNQFEVNAAGALDVTFSGFRIDGTVNAGVDPGGEGSGFISGDGDLNDVWFEDMWFSNQIGGDVNLNRGAGIHIQNMDGDLTIIESALYNNGDDLASAAYIYHVGGDVLVQTTAIDSNESTLVNVSGAIFIGDAENVTFSDGTSATDNQTTGKGAVADIRATRTDVLIAEGIYTDNVATQNGGAFNFEGNLGRTDVRDVTFANNYGANGGAIFAHNTGELSIVSTAFDNNDAGSGGAIYIDGLNGSSGIAYAKFLNNWAMTGSGGALFVNTVSDDFGINHSTFSGNTAVGEIGAAVYLEQVDDLFGIFSSTFTDNAFVGEPGTGISLGIGELDDSAYVTNSTFDESSASSSYLIAVQDINSSELALGLSTLVGPGVLEVESNGGFVSFDHSIVDSKGLAAASVVGDPVEAEWSLFSGPLEATIVNGAGNRFSTSALLGPLQNNGGLTDTRLPGAGSPAVNTGDPTLLSYPEFDQRGEGFPRVLEGRIDIGAVEVPYVPVLAATGLSVDVWVPLGGGVVLLLGVGALVFARRRRAA